MEKINKNSSISTTIYLVDLIKKLNLEFMPDEIKVNKDFSISFKRMFKSFGLLFLALITRAEFTVTVIE